MSHEPCDLFKALVENSPDLVWQTDLELRFCFLSAALFRQFGYRADALMGKHLQELLSPDSCSFVLTRLATRLAEEQGGKRGGDCLLELSIVAGNGRMVPAEVSVAPVYSQAGELVGFQGTARNISDRVRIEERIRLSERNYRELVERSHCFILRWSCDGIITFANSYSCEFFGFLPEELVGRPLIGSIVPEIESSSQNLRELLGRIGAHPEQFQSVEFEAVRWDGTRLWVAWSNSPACNAEGKPEILSVGHDISERRQREQQLAYLTVYDPMTGLYNRAYFDTEFERLCRGRQFPVSIVIACLDNLQEVNDTEGREAGDLLLMKASRLLQEGFRVEDLVSRTGGDGFAILLPGLDEQQTTSGLIRFRSVVAQAAQHGPAVSFCMGAGTAHTGPELMRALHEASATMVAERALRKKQRDERKTTADTEGEPV